MRRIVIEGDRKVLGDQLETALAEVANGESGYITANLGDPTCEVEFVPCDPEEDPDADWTELQARFSEVPD